MQITVDIPGNKQYSPHRGRRSYRLINTGCNAMLLLWSTSNVISLNRFNHFRACWTQTNVITAWSLERHTCSPVAIQTELNTGDSIQVNKLDLETSAIRNLSVWRTFSLSNQPIKVRWQCCRWIFPCHTNKAHFYLCATNMLSNRLRPFEATCSSCTFHAPLSRKHPKPGLHSCQESWVLIPRSYHNFCKFTVDYLT